MDIESLVDFTTLAACKSFSKAAALRNVTQPAFSRRIRALEAVVGADLIEHQNKNFRLTPAGKRFIVHAKNLVELANRAIDDTKSIMTRLHDPVYIVAPPYLSKTFFPMWYKAMQRAVPGLTMRLSHQRGSSAIEDLRKGTADFALVLYTKKVEPCYTFEGLQTRVIGKDRMLAVCSRHDATADNLLMYDQGSYMSECADIVLGNRAAAKNVVFESSSTGLLKEMAIAGFGMAVLPESIAGEDLVQGYLKPVKGIRPLECDILLVRAPLLPNKKAEKLWAANAAPKS